MEVSNCADSGVCVQDDGAVTFTGGHISIHHNGRRRNIRRFVSKFDKRTLPTLPTLMACFDNNLLARQIHELVFHDIDTS